MSVNPYVLAVDLRDRVAALFEAAGVDCPADRYVAPGDSATIAFDGPALMINVDWVALGQPGTEQTNRPAWPQMLQMAQFSVTLVRDAATMDDQGNPPSTDQIQADAQAQITDLITMQNALVEVRQSCQAFDGSGWVGPGTPVVLGRVVPVGPMGAAMAVVGQVQVTLCQ